jgi:hypothetical protein
LDGEQQTVHDFTGGLHIKKTNEASHINTVFCRSYRTAGDGINNSTLIHKESSSICGMCKSEMIPFSGKSYANRIVYMKHNNGLTGQNGTILPHPT